jgi:hypothetical protein
MTDNTKKQKLSVSSLNIGAFLLFIYNRILQKHGSMDKLFDSKTENLKAEIGPKFGNQ